MTGTHMVGERDQKALRVRGTGQAPQSTADMC